MRTSVMRAVLALAGLTAVAGIAAGTAHAAGAPVGARPSACRPANHLGKITRDTDSLGHRHYRVTLTAAPGCAPCVLAGSPKDVELTRHNNSVGMIPGRYGHQHRRVLFGPHHPVHFDLQVPSAGHHMRGDGLTFTLRAPGGDIPGESGADGRIEVGAGTLVGPVLPGA